MRLPPTFRPLAMLVVGLFGGVIFDRWRPDRAMIGSRAWSAVFSLLPVVGYALPGWSGRWWPRSCTSSCR